MRVDKIISFRIPEKFLCLPHSMWLLCFTARIRTVTAVVCVAVGAISVLFCRIGCSFLKQETWKSRFYPAYSSADSTAHSLSHAHLAAPEESFTRLAVCETLCKILHEASLVRRQRRNGMEFFCFPEHPLPGLRPAMMFTLAVFPQGWHVDESGST